MFIYPVKGNKKNQKKMLLRKNMLKKNSFLTVRRNNRVFFQIYQSKSGLRKTDRAEITGQKRF